MAATTELSSEHSEQDARTSRRPSPHGDDPGNSIADPEWFREPSLRERRLGAALFVAFGVFFVVLFRVERGWGFRWVILGLGVVSLWRGLAHALQARRRKQA